VLAKKKNKKNKKINITQANTHIIVIGYKGWDGNKCQKD